MSGEHENLNSNQRPTRLVDSDAHAQIHVSAPASEDLAAENGAPSAAEFSGLLYVPEASTPEAEKQLLSGPYYLGLSVVDSGPVAGLALSELGVVPIDPNTPIKDEKKEEEDAAAGTVERRNAEGKKIRDDRRTVVFKKKYKKDQRCWYEQYFFSKVYAYKDNPRPDATSPPDEDKRIKSADDPAKPVLVGGKGQVKPGESGKTGKPWKNDTDGISAPNSDSPIGSQSFPNPTKTKPDEDSGEGTIKITDHPKFVEDTKNIYEGWDRDKWVDKGKDGKETKGRTNAERSGEKTAPKWFEWVLDFYTYFICDDKEVAAWHWQLRVLMHVKDANTIEEDWSDITGPEKTEKTREEIHGRKDYPKDPPNPKDTTTGK